MFYIANGVLSAISDNVFVATVYIGEVKAAFDNGILTREQFDLLAVAINTGTNIPSVATPNGPSSILISSDLVYCAAGWAELPAYGNHGPALYSGDGDYRLAGRAIPTLIELCEGISELKCNNLASDPPHSGSALQIGVLPLFSARDVNERFMGCTSSKVAITGLSPLRPKD